ncbi:MAG: hypothetical protein M3R17_20150, partial [Bacteroidota bacterium]|nr:hypothetical protein [Bacteroidota bacterium]
CHCRSFFPAASALFPAASSLRQSPIPRVPVLYQLTLASFLKFAPAKTPLQAQYQKHAIR